MARIATLWRYPVKSMTGESVEELAIDARGAVGDRAVAVVTASGKVASGKTTRRFERVDGLIHCRAATAGDGSIEIVLPDGTATALDAAALSRALGRELSYAREGASSHFDVAGLHLVTTATLAWAREQSGVATDVRRVRANLVIDAGDRPHREEAWIGSELTLGTARVRITEPTERCVMTTFGQGDLPAAPEVLRAIAERPGSCLGVYAEVVVPGVVRVGDAVEAHE